MALKNIRKLCLAMRRFAEKTGSVSYVRQRNVMRDLFTALETRLESVENYAV